MFEVEIMYGRGITGSGEGKEMQREMMRYAEMDEREDGDGWIRVGVGRFSLRGGEPLHFG